MTKKIYTHEEIEFLKMQSPKVKLYSSNMTQVLLKQSLITSKINQESPTINAAGKVFESSDSTIVMNPDYQDATIVIEDPPENPTMKINKGDTMASKKRKTKKKNNKRKQKKKSNAKKIIISILIFLFLSFLAVAGYLTYLLYGAYQETVEITDDNFWQNETSVEILNRNDEFVTSLSMVNSEWVPLCADEETNCGETGNYYVSDYYINGLIDTEDYNYYDHGPVNIFGLAKATLKTLLTSDDRGGSTLTMQLGKLIYMNDWVNVGWDPETGELTDDPEAYARQVYEPINYKLTQMAYAIKIEQNYSKEEILENLINTMFFGYGNYGIENASQFYFNKSSTDLTLVEGATLAGITNGPSLFDPYLAPDLCQQRRDIVLLSMLNEGSITQEEYDEAVATDLESYLVVQDTTTGLTSDVNLAYVDQVYRELIEIFTPDDLSGNSFDVSTAGLTVHTSLDPLIQQATYDAQHTDEFYEDELLESGSATVDPQTGEILALGSGRETISLLGTNYATNYTRQPGSTAKPIVAYGPAIEFSQLSTAHVFTDEETFFTGGTEVKNSDLTYKGDVTMQAGLAYSLNTIAVRVFQNTVADVGLTPIEEFYEGLGVSDGGVFTEVYAIGGWDYGTTPLEIAAAYAAFANGGTYYEPHAITQIDIAETSPYYEEFGATYIPEVESHTAMSPETSYMITDMLSLSQPETISARYQDNPSGISAKSGTSNWGSNDFSIPEDAARDNWFVGYNANFVTASWTGFLSEDEKEGVYYDGYARTSQRIFNAVNNAIVASGDEYLKDDTLEQPDTVVSVELEPNVWPPIKSSNGRKYLFIKDSEDYQLIEDDFSEGLTDAPEVTVDVTSSAIDLSWTYDGNYRDSTKWNIYIDGKLIETTDKSSISIPFSDFATEGTCNASYKLEVEQVETNSVDETRKSKKFSKSIDITTKDYCIPLDSDNDGIIDSDEESAGTDINNPDTDGDGITDFDEIEGGSDPLDPASPETEEVVDPLDPTSPETEEPIETFFRTLLR